MPDKLVAKSAFADLVDALIAESVDGGPAVIGAQLKRAGGDREVFDLGPLARADQLRLDFDVTISPPKRYLQPPCEDLLRYTTGETPSLAPVFDDQKRVIIGVHPYDMAAINQMDAVFQADNPDQHYLRRRANTTLVCVTPQRAGRRAFADQLGRTNK